MIKVLTTSQLFFVLTFNCFAQSAFLPINDDQYHLLDRFEILNGKLSSQYHSTVKPYQRKKIAAFLDSLYKDSLYMGDISSVDKFNLEYLANDNWEWSNNDKSDSEKSLWHTFYRKKGDFYHVEEEDFDLHINPVVYFSVGKESESDVTTYTNTRGVDVRGTIAGKLGFYSYLTTTQAVFPDYVREKTLHDLVVPGAGYWKKFKTNGVDYFTAKGYLTFDLVDKYVNAQFGFDNSFIGDGYRSLILSDYAPGYTFLKLNTKIWRLNYTNLFAQLRADAYANPSGSLESSFPPKFIASHHLSLNITDKFNVGLFETVVIGDSLNHDFKVGYLNPIIFYRALEHQGGSSENVIVGTDAKWLVGNSVELYGQLVLDEFFLKEVKSGDGWWANKFGGQMGMKYVNVFGMDNLDLQLEYNVARPYFHAHHDVYKNYAHYRQPLGHPLGANFKEVVTKLRYQPFNKFILTGQINIASYGEDTVNSNWGKDVMKSYNTREQDYNNKIGQGVATKLFYGDMTFTYHFKHNFFFDLSIISRRIESKIDALDRNTFYYSFNMRWNIARTIHDF